MKSLRRIFLFAFCLLSTIGLVACSTGSTAEVVTETEAEEMVAAIKADVALAEGLVVENDITLKTSYEAAPDAIIAWNTSDAALITSAGVVTRPEHAVGDQVVTLSVVITVPYNQNAAGETYYGRIQKTYNFEVTVKAMPYVPTDEDIANGYLAEVADLSGEYTSNITLPAVTNGAWSISGDLAIVDGAVVVEQTEAVQTATLTITVTVGAAVVSKDFTITVPAKEVVQTYKLYYYNTKGWDKVNAYIWEHVDANTWPGVAMTEVEDNWYELTLSAPLDNGKLIFNNGSGTQTADISFAGNYYFYGTHAEGFATKEEAIAHFNSSEVVYYTIYYYNSNNWSKVNIHMWSHPCGTSWPGAAMTQEEDGWYSFTVDAALTGAGFLFHNTTGTQTGDIKFAGNYYYYGTNTTGYASKEEVLAQINPVQLDIYLRGSHNSWGTTDKFAESNGVYTITVDLEKDATFKIADESWEKVNINGAAIVAKDSVNFGISEDNAKVLVAGKYTFTVSDGALLSVERIIDEEAEANKILDQINLPNICGATLDLPQIEGLTWSVKEGTAIVITDGVVTVLQTAVEQEVTLTATATYGAATVSRDLTITVLPLVPTDEEIANGYLNSVEDLSGEYTADVTLPAVTNGVWSAEGAEVVEGVLVIAQTTEIQTIVLTLTVTVGEYVGTRTFTVTVPAMEVVTYPTLHYYNSDNWASVYVYEWTVDPRVAWPGTKLEVVDGWVHYELSYHPTGYNYIFNDGSSKQTSDVAYNGNTYFYGTVGQAFATEEAMMAHLNANKLIVYIRGTLNNWGTSNPLTDLGDGTYTITVDLAQNAQFKFATEDWSTVNIAGSTIANADKVNFKAEGDNAVAINEGTYKFVITKTSIVSIEKIIDEAAEAQKIMDTVSLHETCQDALELPTAEGLTWSVKEGTAIVIADGVATVTQGDADQVVVLTATVVYGETTITKDFTVTVLALTISDEDLANTYLAEAGELSGTYKNKFTLPTVTNGTWSVSGDGLSLSGNTAVVTRAEVEQSAVLTLTVTVNEVVLTKDFQITIPLAHFIYYYNTKSWSKVNIYYWPTGGEGSVAWPGVAMTKSTSNTKLYYYASDIPFTGYSIIFNNGSSQTGDIAYSGQYYYGEYNKGFDSFEAADAHYQANKNITPIYIRGSMNNWGTATAFTYNSDTQEYTLTITLAANAEFKFADSGWSSVNIGWAGFKNVAGATTNFSQSGENIKCKVAGTYTFTIKNKAVTTIVKA